MNSNPLRFQKCFDLDNTYMIILLVKTSHTSPPLNFTKYCESEIIILILQIIKATSVSLKLAQINLYRLLSLFEHSTFDLKSQLYQFRHYCVI